MLQGVKPFAITLYVESVSRVIDQRTVEDKNLVRLVGMENVFAYLETIRTNNELVWDIAKVRNVIRNLDAMSASNFERHMEGKK